MKHSHRLRSLQIRIPLFLVALVCLSLPRLASGQDVLIRGAKVYTLSSQGVLEGSDVLIRNGRVESVGRNLAGDGNIRVVDANGRMLTPGLFAGLSGIGLEEVSGESATVDDALALHAPAYEAQWRPEFDVTLAYNPRSVVVPVTRVEGFTWTVLSPGSPTGGSILAGQGSAVRLDGSFDAALPGSQSLFVSIGGDKVALSGGSRAGQFMLLEQAVRETRLPGMVPGGHGLLLPVGREVFARYLSGGRVVFRVDRAADIRQAVLFAKRNGMTPVIAGGAEAWVLARELAEAKVPVLVDPLENLPTTFDQIAARLDSAAILHRAGVTIAFAQSGDASHQARKLRQLAGNAVAHGLPWDAALAALTTNPAQIFGQAERGRIETGQVADVVLWSGDPLEVTTVAEQVWIGGKEMPMKSRQTELRDRYLKKARP
jgi:hypothetical protein